MVLILPTIGFQEAILSNSPKVHHRRLRAVVIKVSGGHRCNLDELHVKMVSNSTAQKMAKLKEMNGALKIAFGIKSMISGFWQKFTQMRMQHTRSRCLCSPSKA